MSELKPCPFCGNEYPMITENSMGVQITCPVCQTKFRCDCTAGHDYSKAETIKRWNRRAQPAACEIAEYAEDCKDCGFCAQPANEPLIDVCAMLEQAAQDMDDKCRQWQCVLQRVHDAGTFDQNSGLWVGVDKEREAKAQASFEAYRYALGVIDKIAEHVSNPYKFAHKPGGEQE